MTAQVFLTISVIQNMILKKIFNSRILKELHPYHDENNTNKWNVIKKKCDKNKTLYQFNYSPKLSVEEM